jgi:hypothetical protein
MLEKIMRLQRKDTISKGKVNYGTFC